MFTFSDNLRLQIFSTIDCTLWKDNHVTSQFLGVLTGILRWSIMKLTVFSFKSSFNFIGVRKLILWLLAGGDSVLLEKTKDSW